MRIRASQLIGPVVGILLFGALPGNLGAQQPSTSFAGNPICEGEGTFYNPGNGEDIALPDGYSVSVFAKDLNFPTSIAFRKTDTGFEAFVVESGTGLPGRCNNNEALADVGKFGAKNPFTPDILVLDGSGRVIRGPVAKPTDTGGGYQPDGPAIGLVFENGFAGGRLFATDSNQGIRGAPGRANNTSRILIIEPDSGAVTPFITGLPTGDHPTEMVVVKGGYLYWSQGSATNSGVTGHDNGAGGNQQEIPCENITLSQNVWDSGDGHMQSGFSRHGLARPGAAVAAFESATHSGMCTGAILRAPITAAPGDGAASSVRPVSWGYRNPFGLQFAPADHPLGGGLFVTVNGEDERGARPTNNAPDRLDLVPQAVINGVSSGGRPDWHGWPDWFGGMDSEDPRFLPIGGPADDLAKCDARGTNCDFSQVMGKDRPVRHVLASPPSTPVVTLALEVPDVAAVQPDFAPDSFVHGIVRHGAALVPREGDFGFSLEPAGPPEGPAGHDIELVNFSTDSSGKAIAQQVRFAFNCPQSDQRRGADGTPTCASEADQAFSASLRGINRPVSVAFGPDGALYLVDYGIVRDFGRSDPPTRFLQAADSPLVQVPHTGVIWRIARTGSGGAGCGCSVVTGTSLSFNQQSNTVPGGGTGSSSSSNTGLP
jgi:hypothetical protein